MSRRRAALVTVSVLATLATVAGCTSGSDGDTTPTAAPTDTVTTTATATATAVGSATSADPPTGSGVPASSTAPAGQSGGNASGPGLCTPTVMTFEVTRNDGAAGSVYFEIRATNASSSPCVTTGFPGVAFLDTAGTTILNAARTDASEVATIVVQPGQVVRAQVQAESVDAEAGGTPCPSSPRFLLTMPDNTDSTTITHTTPVCRVSVSPFKEGADR